MINDNPNLDAGVEDADWGDALYVSLLSHFLKQVESRYVSTPARQRAPASPVQASRQARPIGELLA